MERRPEPELMNEAAQAAAYASADFSQPHEHYVQMFADCFPSLEPAGTYLDLGCGPGDITLRFARRYPALSLHGVDGAELMLAHGAHAASAAGLAERVRFVHRYLPTDDLPLARYDGIISNSLLHHLEHPEALWCTIRERCIPGGPVYVMDLLRPDSEAAAARLVAEHSAGEPEILRGDFFRSLLAAYRPAEVRAQIEAAGLMLEVRVASDRHWIAWGTVRGAG